MRRRIDTCVINIARFHSPYCHFHCIEANPQVLVQDCKIRAIRLIIKYYYH